MAEVWECPIDFGEELGDPSLHETLLLDPLLYGSTNYLKHREYSGQSVDARSVLFISDPSQISSEQSESLRDSPAHLPNHMIFKDGVDILPDWFQRHLNTMSTLGISSPDAIAALSQFLSQQPPQSTLHDLAIGLRNYPFPSSPMNADESGFLSTLVQSLNSPHCKIDGFVLDHASTLNECLLVTENLLRPQLPLDGNVGCRGCEFQYLGFRYCNVPEEAIEILAKMLQSPASKLSELSLYGSCNFVANFESLRHLATALQQGQCKLIRLDIRGCGINKEGLKLLFQSLQDSQMPIRDLGLSIEDDDLEHMAILGEALGNPLLHFQILRLHSYSFQKELAAFLAEALGGQHCKVLALDLTLFNMREASEPVRHFCQMLQQQQHKVQCLRLFEITAIVGPKMISVLANFLSSNGCALVCLECRYNFEGDYTAELILAEALENNYKICTLSFPWRNRAAEARASSFLKRNRLYRSGRLLEQEFVRPHRAKLFICGHAEVGKTTLRNSLLKASTLCNQHMGCGSLVHLCGTGPAHTRGMELHTLSFDSSDKGEGKELVICDLAGQQEYHAFHHYFISGSNKDLFMVVCKYHSSRLQSDLESELEYWLRFIACHRSSSSIESKPKVIMLLNFFDDATDMDRISRSKCKDLLDKYIDVLDFGVLAGEENVFGIVATKVSEVIPLLEKLEDLLGQLLQSRAAIPKICKSISSHIQQNLFIKGRLCGMQHSSKVLFLPYSKLFNSYVQCFCARAEDAPKQETFEAALLELHNAGRIVFFRPVQAGTDPVVITDCRWFCHDLIGSLLAPMEFRSSFKQRVQKPWVREKEDVWVWEKEDVKQMLRKQKCKEYLDEILRCLESLELCYPITLPESTQKQSLLFPALLRNNLPEEENQADMIFLGRRLKCQDTAKQLLPSGVFARLQVKLHSFCRNLSYKVGCGLIRFSKDFVRVVVRFEGDTGRWEDRQWIDILISYPDNRHSLVAENIMDEIKDRIHEICQGTERGCPTVLLEECILRNKNSNAEALPLALIQIKVREKGIYCSVEWEDGSCDEAIKFLLPSELQQHATHQFHAVADVHLEFSVTDQSNRGSSSHSWEMEVVSGMDESYQKLWQLIRPELDKIKGSLQDINNRIDKLANSLKEVQESIISNCSTHLLTQLLDSPLPLYPYLTDTNGKWQKLMSLVAGDRMELHFMCEEGPHEIEEQKGLTVVVKPAEWLVKIAPVLMPAFRVFCCAARLAATVYLPGSSNVFVPSPNFLQSLGLSDDALQRQILPKALKALVGGIPCNVGKLSGQPLEKSEVRECLADLLQDQDVNMRRDFLLWRVVIDGKGKRRISWVCKKHAVGKTPLHDENPFA